MKCHRQNVNCYAPPNYTHHQLFFHRCKHDGKSKNWHIKYCQMQDSILAVYNETRTFKNTYVAKRWALAWVAIAVISWWGAHTWTELACLMSQRRTSPDTLQSQHYLWGELQAHEKEWWMVHEMEWYSHTWNYYNFSFTKHKKILQLLVEALGCGYDLTLALKRQISIYWLWQLASIWAQL